MMKVVDINTYLIGKTMYRWHTGLLPSIFNDHFVHNKNIHSCNTRQSNWLLVPRVKTEYRKRTIRYRGATVWNFMMKNNINPNKSEASLAHQLKNLILAS